MKSVKGLVRQALRLKKNEVGVEVGTNMTRKKIIFFKIVRITYILIFPADFEKWAIF